MYRDRRYLPLRSLFLALLLLGTTLLFPAPAPAQQETEGTITQQVLVGLMVRLTGLDALLPEAVAGLSPAELYRIQVAVLVENGFPMFADLPSDQPVTLGYVVDVLTALLHPDQAGASFAQKLATLVREGYLKEGGAETPMPAGEMVAAFNNPALAQAVAEAYSPPGVVPLGVPGTPPPGLTGFLPEVSQAFTTPASPFLNQALGRGRP